MSAIRVLSTCHAVYEFIRVKSRQASFHSAFKLCDGLECPHESRFHNYRTNEDLDFVKAKTKEAALSSYRSYNNNVPQNLSKEEFTALQISLKIKTW